MFVAASASLPRAGGEAQARMADAARDFLAGLDPIARSRAQFEFDSAKRLDWHFVPRERAGVSLAELTVLDRARLRRLLESALSAAGVARFDGVLVLESLLREIESRPGAPAEWRDPGRFHVAIYGQPDVMPWGWRLEGHHWSSHFTSVSPGVVCVTPQFVGANPARVHEGEHANFELLAQSDSAARAFVLTLPEDLRARAKLPGATPQDVLWSPGHDDDPAAAGLAVRDLDADARKRLGVLAADTFDDLTAEWARAERARFLERSDDSLRFSWAGDPTEGKAWYWRLQTDRAVVEFSNPAGNAGHAHRLWRDLERDFGGEPLAEHLRREH